MVFVGSENDPCSTNFRQLLTERKKLPRFFWRRLIPRLGDRKEHFLGAAISVKLDCGIA
jgi:hypothetical protein